MLNLLIGFTAQYLNDNVKCFDTTMLLSSSVACTKQKVPHLIKTVVYMCYSGQTDIYKHIHALTYAIYIIISIVITRNITCWIIGIAQSRI